MSEVPQRCIFLLRHGQEAESRDGPDGGGLSALGQQQAALAAARLRDEVALHRIVSSTLLRAAETAQAVQRCFPHLSIEHTDALRETIPSLPPELRERFPDLTPELLAENAARLDGVLGTYFSSPPEGPTLLVCHGNVIRYLVSRLLGMAATGWLGMGIHNAGLCRIHWSPTHRRMVSGFNDIGHLPAEARTTR